MKLGLNLLKYEDVRQQMVEFLKSNSDYNGQFDFTNSNNAFFIDAMAYINMIVAYNTSHIANNIFLDSTEERKNAVSKAKNIGYSPKRPVPAKFSGKLIYKGVNFKEGDSITITTRSPFVGSFGNIYTSNERIILSYKGNPTQLEGDYIISEGSYQYYTSTPTGESNYSFIINNKKMTDDDMSLYVIPTSVNIGTPPYSLVDLLNHKWNRVKTFADISTNNIYYLEEDIVNEGYAKIVFGNGTFGTIPSIQNNIVCEYKETLGSNANGENLVSLPTFNTDNYILSFANTEDRDNFSLNNFDVSYQSVYNKSYGGSDLEDINSIKYNAPKFYNTTGRAVTRNDYIYLLSSYAGVASANVIGGNELFPNITSELGNVYICIVPNMDMNEFQYNDQIYISSATETQIKADLEDSSVISTKRHFLKPSYIQLNITPAIEIPNNISIAEQQSIKTQVKNTIQNYFVTNFNKMGIPFRESKMSVNVDSLPFISSSKFSYDFSFVLNHKTVENLIDNFNNMIYLPIKNLKDSAKNVIGTTNFIKTNTQVIKEDILFNEDWTILNKTYSALSDTDKINYKLKTKLLNNYHNIIKPEQCAIYTKNALINPNLDRFIYNKDYEIVTLADVWFNGNVLYNTTTNFFNELKEEILVNIVEDILYFGITENNLVTNKPVGNLYISYNPYNVTITLTDEHIQNLIVYFGIDESQFIYTNSFGDKIPFQILQKSNAEFIINFRLVSYLTNLLFYGKSELLNVNDVKNILTADEHSNTKYKDWEIVDGDKHSTITYKNALGNTETLAIVEKSHKGLTKPVMFKGFVGSGAGQITYKNILDNISIYDNYNYFIVTDFIATTGDTYENNQYYFKDDILIVKTIDNVKTLVKGNVTRTVSSYDKSSLNAYYFQGDIFVNDSGSNTDVPYYIYDTNSLAATSSSDKITEDYFKPITEINANKLLDASQSLPKALTENTMVKIVIDPADDNDNGVPIKYAGFSMLNKITTLYYKDHLNNTNTPYPSNYVMDGDVLVYHDSNWFVAFNTLNKRTLPINDNIISFSQLNTTELLQVYKITAPIIIDTDDRKNMFVVDIDNQPPIDGMLNIGDYVINIGNSKFLIFDDDFYKYHINPILENSKFPIPLEIGNVFTVYSAPNAETKNFAGDIQNVEFTYGDKILYIDKDTWRFYNNTNALSYKNKIVANNGDILELVNSYGTLDNSPLLNTNLYETVVDNTPTFNNLLNYNDKLYYYNGFWTKVKPINIYTMQEKETTLNDLGFNSDFHIEQNSPTTFKVVLYDVFHDSSFGKLDYYTGKLSLATSINKNLNKTNVLIGKNTLSDIFNKDNYGTIQMDTINFKTVTGINGAAETDFDTQFNQFIIANVKDTIII